MKKLSLILFLLILTTSVVFSQEVISSNGNTSKVGDIEVSWTLGEGVIQTVTNGTNTLTQGFHQSKLIVTAIYDTNLDIQIKVYPNPTTHRVFIDVGIQQDLYYELFNANGKLLKQNTLESPLNKINTESLANGTYFLKIHDRNSLIQTYKLVKLY